MTLEGRVPATTDEWASAHKPIVVAVDGSERNRSAYLWAAAEAASSGCEVVLVTAIDDHPLPVPHFSIRSEEQSALDMLGAVRREVRHVVAEQVVATEVATGSSVEVLLNRSENARLLVVGKRGLGSFARAIVGSTSIAVAGRAKVPVAVIPDSWKQEDHRDAPVLVGVNPHRPEQNPIRLAFLRAQRLGVRLLAVHGWETPATYTWDSAVLASVTSQWEQAANAEFDKVLDVWRDRFPDVDVEAVHSHNHPAMAVLDAAEHAQLVALGRHTDSRLGGFSFGSVTRAVLHYAECPVMVVPTKDT